MISTCIGVPKILYELLHRCMHGKICLHPIGNQSANQEQQISQTHEKMVHGLRWVCMHCMHACMYMRMHLCICAYTCVCVAWWNATMLKANCICTHACMGVVCNLFKSYVGSPRSWQRAALIWTLSTSASVMFNSGFFRWRFLINSPARWQHLRQSRNLNYDSFMNFIIIY